MPADLSPSRRRRYDDDAPSSRRLSLSPRRDADRDRDRSPPRHVPKKPKELSMYKRSAPSGGGREGAGGAAGSTGSFASRRDPLDRMPARERERERESLDVPGRYGGQRGSGSGAGGGGGARGYERDREGGRGGYGDARGGGHDRGYRDGESLQRVRTRDDRDDRRDRGYRDGDSLSRVKTRDERDARPLPDASGMGMGKTPAVGEAVQVAAAPVQYTTMIEIIANDRLGRKVRVKCSPLDTVGDLKKLIAAQTGTPASKIQLKKWYSTFKDHITLRDYEINDGMSLEMY